MDKYLKQLERDQRERRAELGHLKSGSVSYGRRRPGAIEFEDLVPREIALLERDIALYEPLIAQLRGELRPMRRLMESLWLMLTLTRSDGIRGISISAKTHRSNDALR